MLLYGHAVARLTRTTSTILPDANKPKSYKNRRQSSTSRSPPVKGPCRSRGALTSARCGRARCYSVQDEVRTSQKCAVGPEEKLQAYPCLLRRD